MNFEDLAIGWREALLGIVALLACYVAVAMLRLRRLKKPVAEPPPKEEPPAPAEPPRRTGRNDLDLPWYEPPDPPPDPTVALEARLRQAETEVGQLRDELAVVRGELATVRDEMARQLERMQASQHVAPIYGDAMQMAHAGYDATTIAERCGIARAEAELVVALIRNRDTTESMRER